MCRRRAAHCTDFSRDQIIKNPGRSTRMIFPRTFHTPKPQTCVKHVFVCLWGGQALGAQLHAVHGILGRGWLSSVTCTRLLLVNLGKSSFSQKLVLS